MAITPLYEKFAAARKGEYCGVETALAFTDARAEFAALLRSCGVYDLGWRAYFRIGGKDRVRWLNGMVSNNIRELPLHRGAYNFVLTPQAHIQGDLYVYNMGEYFLAGTERSQLDKLLTALRRYIIMDKVELAECGEEFTSIGVQGPSAREVLAKAGFSSSAREPLPVSELSWRGQQLWATRMGIGHAEAYELWIAPADAPAVWDALVSAGAIPTGMDAFEMFRVAGGIPRYGVDIRERDLPQETGQMQALNFTKGCYIGQEIVERIRSRGAVHRAFSGFTIQGPPPAPGTKLQAAGKDVGEITSALEIPLLPASGGEQSSGKGDASITLALGYIRREAAQPDAGLQAGGVEAKVSPLPFPEIFASELTNAQ